MLVCISELYIQLHNLLQIVCAQMLPIFNSEGSHVITCIIYYYERAHLRMVVLVS
jgi:hypothetical protein